MKNKRRSRASVQREITNWIGGALLGHGSLLSRTARRRWVALLRQAGIAAAVVLLAGCATRQTVLVDTARDMVMITRPVKANVAVWQSGRWVENGKMEIPAGWICGPERKP